MHPLAGSRHFISSLNLLLAALLYLDPVSDLSPREKTAGGLPQMRVALHCGDK